MFSASSVQQQSSFKEEQNVTETESDIFADAVQQPPLILGSSINDDWTDRPYTTGDMQDAPPLLKIESYSQIPARTKNSVYENEDGLQTPIFIDQQETNERKPVVRAQISQPKQTLYQHNLFQK